MNECPPGLAAYPVMLQRNSFGPRLVARAADVWRAMQDVVVDHSTSVGWAPQRYAVTNSMFVVRTMTVQHTRELGIGEPLIGRTWVSRARRAILFTREVRLFTADALVGTATQEWAYLSRDLQPQKPGPELYAAFPIVEGYPHVDLPTHAPRATPKRLSSFRFRTWHTWMDPFGHINHPAYVDFCDEAVCRLVAAAKLNAQNVVPVAEQVHFRAPIEEDAEVEIETTLVGTAGHAAVFEHRVHSNETVCALATTVRAYLGESSAGWADTLA